MKRAVFVLLALSAGLPTLSSPAAAVAATPTADQYTPCSSGSAVDLLVLMDQSGSLKKTDPGRARAEGLRQLGHLLDNTDDVRVAIVGFKEHAVVHRTFASLVDRPLSEADITEATVQDGQLTDYYLGLAAAVDLFESASPMPDRCRVLVFFTDGILDVFPSETAGEADWATREYSDALCTGTAVTSIKHRLRGLEVQTYAVLLARGLVANNAHQETMLEASKQAIRAITGHVTAPFVQDLPTDGHCGQWGTADNPQTGRIIAVDDVENLANQLRRAFKHATSTFYGCTGEAQKDAPATWKYRKLPAGALIREIDLFLSAGTVTAVRANDRVLHGLDTPSSYLTLQTRHLADLAPGWELAVDVAAPPGARLECESAPIGPLVIPGSFRGSASGQTLDVMDDELRLDLSATGHEGLSCVAFEGIAVSRPHGFGKALTDSYCDDDTLVIRWPAVGELSEDHRIDALKAELEPTHRENAGWGPLPATIDLDTVILSTSDRPFFACTGSEEINTLRPADGGRLVAARAANCHVTRVRTGSATVTLSWSGSSTESPNWQLRPSDQSRSPGTTIVFGPADQERSLDVLTGALAPDGLWRVEGTVTVEGHWDPGTGSPQPIGQPLVVKVNVDGLDGRDPIATCSVREQPLHTETPGLREILLTDGCTITPAKTGDTRVSVVWEGRPETGLNWCIDSAEGCAPRLTVGSGGDTVAFDVRSPLPEDGAWEPQGTVTILVDWAPGGDRPSERIATFTSVVNVDRLASYRDSDPLQCPNEGLGGLDEGEVPFEPVVADGSCVISAPTLGLAQACLSWSSADAAADGISWTLHDPTPPSALSVDDTCLLLTAGGPDTTVGFSTTQPLENREWDTSGEIVVRVSWMPAGVTTWVDAQASEIAEARLSTEVRLLRQSNTGTALLLALLLALAVAVVTYAALYLLLRRHDRLPEPTGLFYLNRDVQLERNQSGRLAETATQNGGRPPGSWKPDINDLAKPSGSSKELRLGDITIRAQTAPFWNVTRLMGGGWGEPHRSGWVFHAEPGGAKLGTSELHFTHLTLVAIDLSSPPEAPRATISYLVPAGQAGGLPAIEALARRSREVIADATHPYDLRLEELQRGSGADPDAIDPQGGTNPPLAPQPPGPPTSGAPASSSTTPGTPPPPPPPPPQ